MQTDVDKIEPPSPVPSPAASSAPAFQPIILETEGSYARRISTSASADPLRRKCHQQPESFQDRQPKDSTCEISPRQFASSVTDDHFETFGRYVAGKLRKSMPRQSIIAEKVIAEVLLRANLGTLEEATCLTEKVPSRCFLVMGDRWISPIHHRRPFLPHLFSPTVANVLRSFTPFIPCISVKQHTRSHLWSKPTRAFVSNGQGRTANHRLPVEQNTTSTNLLARMADRSHRRRVNSGSQPIKQDLLFSYAWKTQCTTIHTYFSYE